MSKQAILDRVSKRLTDIAAPDLAVRETHGTSEVRTPPNRHLEVWCTATDDTVDDEGEVILPDGIDMGYLMARKAVYVDHKYALSSAVAKLRSITRKGPGWESHNQIIDAETNETRAIIGLAKAGMLCQSITVHRLDSGKPTPAEAKKYQGATRITRKSKAIELSFTAWPMNPSCVQIAMKSKTAKERIERVRAVFKSIDADNNLYELFRVPQGRVYYIN